jgi:hypothetical protein
MSSKKCSICGLTNFGSAVVCKRCNQSLTKQTNSKSQQNTAVRPVTAAKQRPQATSADDSEAQAQRKRMAKMVGGSLIALGLVFGLITALTQEYYYLAVGGPALLIGGWSSYSEMLSKSQLRLFGSKEIK